MKKLFRILLIPILLLMICQDVSAETVYTEDTLKYVIRNNEITIVKYFGLEKEVVIPRTINNVPVTTIASGAFVDTSATSVILPDSIAYIEEGAFSSTTSYISEKELENNSINPDDSKAPKEEHKIVDNNDGEIADIPSYEVEKMKEIGEVDVDGEIVIGSENRIEESNKEINEIANPTAIERTYEANNILYIVLCIAFLAIVAFIGVKKKVKK